MTRYFIFSVTFLILTSISTLAQKFEMKIEVRNSQTNELSSNLTVRLENGKPDFKLYLYDFEKPSWKGGDPLKSITAGNSREGEFTDIPFGKYYVVAEDAEKEVAVKLVNVTSNAK